MPGVLGNRAGNRVIEAAVKRPKLINLDGSVRLKRQIGDGLANVAVVPNHLLESEPLYEQISPVKHPPTSPTSDLSAPLFLVDAAGQSSIEIDQ